MTPQDAIQALDVALVMSGQDIDLTRFVAPSRTPVTVTCRAKVKNGDVVQSEGAFGKFQASFLVILSPTPIDAAGWPGVPATNGFDPRIPVNGDQMLINGHVRTVQVARGIYLANALVRIEAQALG